METRRMEEHFFAAGETTQLLAKVTSLIEDANLSNYTITKREDGGFELQLQLKYPTPQP